MRRQIHLKERNCMAGRLYPVKKTPAVVLKELVAEAKDARALSVPLMMTSLLGKEKSYAIILKKMEAALELMPTNTTKAWLIGRVLLAAKHQGDETTLEKYLPEMKALLKSAAPQDPHAAWAWGYLAGLSKEEYAAAQKNLFATTLSLIEEYNTKKSTAAFTNALWAITMGLYATAQMNHEEDYRNLLGMCRLIDPESPAMALFFAIPASDGRAWAMGLAMEAAVKMKDSLSYDYLVKPSHIAIQVAKTCGHTVDACMGEIYAASAMRLSPIPHPDAVVKPAAYRSRL